MGFHQQKTWLLFTNYEVIYALTEQQPLTYVAFHIATTNMYAFL